ncbi:tandem-95 repeat protein [Photobacterium angustum]|uniref:tandem-95 repeat protein n=1 Tax=Photobacterium angustum TaxID=661 RepID=UPI000CF3681C|nr:tandem-95 repeat protein [Photobacterium angustum]
MKSIAVVQTSKVLSFSGNVELSNERGNKVVTEQLMLSVGDTLILPDYATVKLEQSDGTEVVFSNVNSNGAKEELPDEIANLQALIASGEDPTLIAEATAAGIQSISNSGGFSFNSIERNAKEIIAESGYDSRDTSPRPPASPYNDSDDFYSPSSPLEPQTPQNDDKSSILINSKPVIVDENGVPEGDSITVSTDEEVAVSGKLSATDADGDSLTFTSSTNPTNGTVTVNTDGTWTYTPNSDFNGEDSFKVEVSDGKGGTDTITVNVTVNPVIVDNNNPQGNDITVTTEEEVAVSGKLSATDVDGDSLTFTSSTNPTNGTVTVNTDGTWTYTPKTNFHGEDSFKVEVSDGNGGTDTITVNVTVNPVNDAPVLVDDNNNPLGTDIGVETDEEVAVSGKLSATDVDGDSLTFTSSTNPTNGTVTVNTDGTWTYTPNSDFNGSDKFDVIVSDGNGGTDTITVNVTVNPVNDAPVLVDDNNNPLGNDIAVTTDEEVAVSGKLSATDVDGDKLTFTQSSNPTNGQVTVNTDGTWTYTPKTNFHGEDSFKVEVSDGNGGTDTITVNVTVKPINDAPVLVDDNNNPLGTDITVTTDEEVAVSGKLSATDVDGDNLTFTQSSNPTNGQVTVNTDGTWTYIPNSDFNGKDSFNVEVSDGNGGTDTITVNVTVNPVNDAPVIVDDNNNPLGNDIAVETDEEVAVSGKLSATDVDGDSLTFTSSTNPTNGTVTVNTDGTWTYTPNSDFNGSDKFDVIVSDGKGGTDTITVNVTVNPINDAPVIVDDNNNPLGTDIAVTTDEEVAVSGKLSATDVDGDSLTFSSSTNPTNGTVTVNTDGTWTYTPNSDFNGSDKFDVIVSDGKGGTDTITVNVTVNPVNDAPVLVDDNNNPLGTDIAVTTDEEVAVSGKLSAIDADGDKLTFTQSSNPTNGQVTVNIDGTWTYTPNSDFNGKDSFNVEVSDGKGGTDTITVNVTVKPINDAPVIVDDNNNPLGNDIAVTTDEEVAVSGKLSATDVDGDSLTFTSSTNPTNGTVTVNTDGTWTYTPNSDFNGSDKFDVIVSDGNGGTDTITVNVTVNPVNDAPVLVDDNNNPLGTDIAVTTDEEVAVSGKLSAIDADGDKLTFTQSSNPTNGQVTVNTDGTWTYTPKTNFHGEDSFKIEVSDGNGGTDTITVNVTVNPINDAPVLVDDNNNPLGTDIAVTTDEEVAVSGKLSAIDADGDSLTFTSSTNPTNGTVTVNTDGTWTYTPNSDFNGSDKFDVIVSDGKGGTDTITVNVTVNPVNDAPVIVDDNNNPLGNDIAVETDEEVAVSGKLSATDVDGDKLTFTQSSNPTNGQVTVNTDGTWTYTPKTNFHGEDSFKVEVSDGKGGTDTITVNVTVNPINDAPVIVDDNNNPLGTDIGVETDEEVAVSGKLSATDVDGDNLTFTQSSNPTNGQVTVNTDGTWIYTPKTNFHGEDSFKVEVSDGNGGTDTITVNVTVNPINDAPVIVDDNNDPLGNDMTVSTDEEVAVSGKLSATDVDGDSLTFTSSTNPTNGTVTVNTDGTWTYTPNSDFNGSDKFDVIVSDGKGGTDTITVNVTVNPINDAPVLVDDNNNPLGNDIAVTTDEEVAVSGKLSAIDADGDSLTFTQSSNPTNGQVTVNTDGTWTYTPKTNFQGEDSFKVEVSDGKGGTDTITVNVTVNPINDAPVIVDDNNNPLGTDITVTTDEEVAVSGKLSATDADGDSLTFSSSTNPTNGTVTVNTDGTWTYTPNSDFNGSDKFDVIVSDGNGGTDTITVNVTVNPVNDAPVIVDDNNNPLGTDIAVTTDEEVAVSGKLSATDVDGDSLTFTSSTNPTNGTVTVNTDGTWTYTPKTNFHGKDSFNVEVSDGNGGTDTITVNVTVNPINDAPVLVDDNNNPLGTDIAVTTDEEVAVSGKLSATDVDGDNLTFTSSTNPTNGTVTVNTDGTWTYTPNSDFNGSDKFDVIVSDGNGGTDTITVNVTVNPVNDAPVIVDDNNNPLGTDIAVTTDEEVAVSGKLSATDVDGDNLTFTSSTNPTNGTVTVNTDGTWTYTPNSDFNGSDKFDVIVSDGKGGTDTITVNVTVNPVNDAPVLVDDNNNPLGTDIAVTTDEEVAVSGKLSAIDADGDKLTFTQSSNPTNGQVTVNTDGTWIYTPNSDFNGKDSFNVEVSDGKGGTDTITVNVTVKPINDAPVLVDDNNNPLGTDIAVTTDEEVAVSGQLSAIDVDGDNLTFTQSSNPTNGQVTVNTDGTWTYTPNSDFNGSDKFDVIVSDGNGGTDTITVNVTVNPINDAPVIVDDNNNPLGTDIAVMTDEEVAVSGKLSAIDADGDKLTFTQSSNPTNGQVAVNTDGTWTYTPNSDFNGSDKFDVIVSDGKGGTDTITVNVTVNPVNDAPVLVDDNNNPLGNDIAVTTDEEVAVSGKLSATDVDGDNLTFTQSSNPTNGQVTVKTDGTWTYTPKTNFHGEDNFKVEVSDGNGGKDIITVKVNVAAVADPILVTINLSSDPIYNSGSIYKDGKDYISWDDTVSELGTNAISLENGTSDASISGDKISVTELSGDGYTRQLSDGSVAIRGQGNADNISGWGTDRDIIVIGEDGVLANNRLDMTDDGSPAPKKGIPLVGDALRGGNGNDILIGEQGDDSLFGGSGTDTAVYSGNFSDYDVSDLVIVSQYETKFTVTDKGVSINQEVYAGEGDDDLYNIERLQFADGTYYWDGGSWIKEQPTYTYTLDINVMLTDTDGSESISQILLSGLPKDTKVISADGTTVLGIANAAGEIELTGLWQNTDTQVSLPGLQITVPAESADSIELTVTAIGKENSSSSENFGSDSVLFDNNIVNGSDVDNDLVGSTGIDILNGLLGNDKLSSGEGNDTLNGGEGDDLLIGGQGNDLLNGGIGADTFTWSKSESISDIDTIRDFDLAEDKLNLSDLLKDATAETLDEFLSISQNNDDSVISIKTGNDKSVNIILEDIDSNSLKDNLGVITSNLLSNDNGEIILNTQMLDTISIDKPMILPSQQDDN